MLRKVTLALVATASLSAMALAPTTASAGGFIWPHHHHHHWGHGHGFGLGFIQGFFGIVWLVPTVGPFITVGTTALYILAIHRYRLLGWNDETKRVPLRISQREFRFLGFVLGVSLLTQLSVYESAFLFKITNEGSPFRALYFSVLIPSAIVQVVAGLLVPPFALALPAIATDGPHPLSTAWSLSRGNYWRLFGILIVFGLPSTLVVRYIIPNPDTILGSTLGLLVTYVTAALVAIALCFVFQDRHHLQLPPTQNV